MLRRDWNGGRSQKEELFDVGLHHTCGGDEEDGQEDGGEEACLHGLG